VNGQWNLAVLQQNALGVPKKVEQRLRLQLIRSKRLADAGWARALFWLLVKKRMTMGAPTCNWWKA
jgi:hypothetical protein